MNEIDNYIKKNMMDIPFDNDDEFFLRSSILRGFENPNSIIPHINLYWQNFPVNDEILDFCSVLICKKRIPRVTAACMGCVNDMWGVSSKFVDCIKDFLDNDRFDFDEWHEEKYKAYQIIVQNEFYDQNNLPKLKSIYAEFQARGIFCLPI